MFRSLPIGVLSVSQQRLVVASVLGVTAATAGVVWWYMNKTSKPVYRPVGTLSDIWIHPVKSCRGHQVQSAECTPDGLCSNGVYDRHFVVLDDTDTFVTMRHEPSLALLQPRISEDGGSLILEAPGMDPLSVGLRDITDSRERLIKFRVWRLDAEGLYCGQEAEAWLSSYLKKLGHKLAFFKPGQTKARKLAEDRSWGGKFKSLDEAVGFQDLAPLMMLTEASVDDLNTRLERPVTMRNLRPNLVVTGASVFEEDQWKYVRIGDSVILRRTHGCGRCKLTTVDPETGVVRSDGEPLATLKQYRTLPKSDPDHKPLCGAPIFGAHLVCDTFGHIRVGDTVYAAV